MGTPVATPEDLGTYLNITTIDTSRALLILGMAQDLCESVVTPLPDSARAVVLDVAARAFVNPQQLHDAAIGTARLQYGTGASEATIGGLYLSRSNKAALRRLAGRGAAFSADLMPTGTDAVQTIIVTATVGTYTLTFNGATTAPIAWNATAAQVQAALQALPSIGAGNVSVSGSYVVAFTGTLGKAPMPLITVDAAGLTGSVAVASTVDGALPPGACLPPWDRDYPGGYRPQGYYGLP